MVLLKAYIITRHAEKDASRARTLCREPVTPSLAVRSSAKSFTAGAHRPVRLPSPADIRGREKEVQGPSPSNVTYTAISQFTQIVELYRGRYAEPPCSLPYRTACTYFLGVVSVPCEAGRVTT